MRYQKGDLQQEDRTEGLKLKISQGHMQSFGVVSIEFKTMSMHEIFKRRRIKEGRRMNFCLRLCSPEITHRE